MRFATRLTLVMALLALGSAMALSYIVSHVVDRSVEERAKERLQRESSLIGAEVATRLDDAAQLDAIVAHAAEELGARVTVVRVDGVVLGDSDVPRADLARLENHATRPEIVAARRSLDGFSVRHSATLGRDLFYLAHRIDARGDVVRLALPYDELRHLESQYEWAARAAIFAVCFLMFVTGSLATNRIARPLRRAGDDALRIAGGDTTLQLDEQGPLEVAELASAINTMKQSLLDVTERVDRERQLGAAVFETLPDGIVIVDRQWRIVDANPAARTLLHAQCTPGQPLIDAVRDGEIFETFEEAVSSRASAHVSVTRPNGATWEVSAHPLPGDRAVAVGILHDVTPFRQNEKMRRRFVADISHELRTPVASIAAAAETLASQPIADDDMRSLVEVIMRQTTRMRELLDDLTDLSLIESGQITLERRSVDLATVAREVACDVAPSARTRDIEISVDGSAAPIEGDHRRIAQIVRNLIDNAVKFSADGSTVRVGIGGGDRDVVISVADSGEGIPDRDLSRIFQRFYQVDRSRSKNRPGSGLGLAIVKHLAQLHHATIDVESAVGIGSTFRVRFPRLQEES